MKHRIIAWSASELEMGYTIVHESTNDKGEVSSDWRYSMTESELKDFLRSISKEAWFLIEPIQFKEER
jgi:hypothetical protein